MTTRSSPPSLRILAVRGRWAHRSCGGLYFKGCMSLYVFSISSRVRGDLSRTAASTLGSGGGGGGGAGGPGQFDLEPARVAAAVRGAADDRVGRERVARQVVGERRHRPVVDVELVAGPPAGVGVRQHLPGVLGVAGLLQEPAALG